MTDDGVQEQAAAAGPAVPRWPVVELRQYTLIPGQREVLIELFDRAYPEVQEELGMQIIGQFRDLDRADRFVWLRGFPDMDSRPARLTAFYTGPVWTATSAAANATLVDIDDVLLLRPAGAGSGFPLESPPRPPLTPAPAGAPAGSPAPAAAPAPAAPAPAAPAPADEPAPAGSSADPAPGSLITATVYPLPGVDPAAEEAALLDFLHARVDPVLAGAGRRPVAELRTEPAPNNYPRLPVRAGEHVVVRFAGYDSERAHAAYRQRLRELPVWQEAQPRLRAHLAAAPRRLRLQPTPRSRLR